MVFLAGCASMPKQELLSAREAVTKAQEAGAPSYAPRKYALALQALNSGETLVEEGEYSKAQSVLPHARELAEAAHRSAILEQTRIAQQLLEKAEKEAREALVAEEEKNAAPPQKEEEPAKKPVAKKKKKSPPPITTYRVGEGETLWSIAAKRKIYRDALLWPLIYKANRDQIKDPRQIYPKQTLSIPRNLTKEEKEEARNEARASKIFPIELFQE